MVSFRFHIVSLTAIFLALALGTAIGATVVDRATVDLLQDQLGNVERRADDIAAENRRLDNEISFLDRAVKQGEAEFVRGRLAGVPVLLITVEGSSPAALEALREAVVDAGAQLQGTLTFTERMRLDSDDHLDALATILATPPSRAETVRRATLQRLAQRATDPAAENLLPALRDSAFVSFEAPTGSALDLATLPVPETRFLVVSDGDPAVPNSDLATPLVGMLAGTGRVVAADLSAVALEAPGPRAAFAGAMRVEAAVAGRVSTVDNAAEAQGRVAVILALADIGAGRFGHYGRGPRASRALPETPG